MKARYYLLLSSLSLVACDPYRLEIEGPVVVNFAQPFPAGVPDLPGFLPRDRKHYVVAGDSTKALIITEKVLVEKRAANVWLPASALDSLAIPKQVGRSNMAGSQRYTVQALVADSFRVQVEKYDTLLTISGPQAPRLRYYRGWYYTSEPSAQDSTKWEVRRLAASNGHIVRQMFNPDSLRVRVLDPATVQRGHSSNGKLVLTLSPRSRRDIGQVSGYAGLWIDPTDYLRRLLGGAGAPAGSE